MFEKLGDHANHGMFAEELGTSSDLLLIWERSFALS